tara:strand:- start:2299 stop:2997 length:699 start_codon:yes stop_codon:yes gene_type:complete
MKSTINKMLIFLLIIVVGRSGTIEGTVNFQGKLPKKKILKLDSDPICGSSHNSKVINESFLVDENNNLQNVIVWIEGIEYSGKLPDEKLVLDQVGCVYRPRILSVMRNQPVVIKNSDATLHNVHSYSKKNRVFNIAMPKVAKEKEVIFTDSEDPFYIKCDVHPWMKSWVAVFDHPYFAVTDEHGNYKIENVPPGEYTIVAFQEKFKMKNKLTKQVKVNDKEPIELDFTFVKK